MQILSQNPATETKVDGMKIDNEFSNLSMNYTVQEFDLKEG